MAGKKQSGRKGQVSIPLKSGATQLKGEKLLRQIEAQGKGRLQVSRHSEKVAKMLWDVAKPVLGRAKKKPQVEQGLRTAMMGWNLACLPEAQRQEMIEQALASVRWPFKWFMRRMITTLIARKQQLYPAEHRMIADIEVTGEAPNWNVKVATVQSALR